MKVAWIAPNTSIVRYDAFFVALRSIVGTTEFIGIDPTNQQSLKRLMVSKNWDNSFDRVVFLLDPQLLFEQRHVLKNCRSPVLLSLTDDNDNRRDAVLNLVKSMPWMRWIGVDLSLCKALNKMGYDAYPIKPINLLDLTNACDETNPEPLCFVYQAGGEQTKQIKALEATQLKKVLIPSSDSSVFREIKCGDIFLFLHEMKHYNPLPMIKAMAKGAIVITLEHDRDISLFYGWQDGHNCIMLEHINNIQETIDILLKNKDVCEAISYAAIETASHYSQSVVGREIGMSLMLPMRDKNDYRQKFNFLGMRF